MNPNLYLYSLFWDNATRVDVTNLLAPIQLCNCRQLNVTQQVGSAPQLALTQPSSAELQGHAKQAVSTI